MLVMNKLLIKKEKVANEIQEVILNLNMTTCRAEHF